MRSSFFVLISVVVHALCLVAIAMAPAKIAPPEGDHTIEVQMGTPADQPGIEQAPAAATVTEAAAPVTPQPLPPAPALEEKEKPLKVAKAATRKTRVVKAPMEKVTDNKTFESKTAETKAAELPVKESVVDDKMDPEIQEASLPAAPAPLAVAPTEKPQFVPVHVKDSAPAGAAEDESTEAGSSDAAKGAEGESAKADAEMAHGGATKAGAVSYLDLKQAPGNKSPQYPMQARRDARQGQVELLYRVTKEGKVTDVQVAKSSGHKDLDQEAARAVSQFKFVPGQEGWARHPVAFNLKGNAAQAPSRLRSAQTE